MCSLLVRKSPETFLGGRDRRTDEIPTDTKNKKPADVAARRPKLSLQSSVDSPELRVDKKRCVKSDDRGELGEWSRVRQEVGFNLSDSYVASQLPFYVSFTCLSSEPVYSLKEKSLADGLNFGEF